MAYVYLQLHSTCYYFWYGSIIPTGFKFTELHALTLAAILMRSWLKLTPKMCSLEFQVNAQWPTILKNLSEMSVVEPLLTKHMVANIATQLGAMESDLPELRKRGLRVEEVEEKWRKCQVCVCV